MVLRSVDLTIGSAHTAEVGDEIIAELIGHHLMMERIITQLRSQTDG